MNQRCVHRLRLHLCRHDLHPSSALLSAQLPFLERPPCTSRGLSRRTAGARDRHDVPARRAGRPAGPPHHHPHAGTVPPCSTAPLAAAEHGRSVYGRRAWADVFPDTSAGWPCSQCALFLPHPCFPFFAPPAALHSRGDGADIGHPSPGGSCRGPCLLRRSSLRTFATHVAGRGSQLLACSALCGRGAARGSNGVMPPRCRPALTRAAVLTPLCPPLPLSPSRWRASRWTRTA
jgi:hypothetical protein